MVHKIQDNTISKIKNTDMTQHPVKLPTFASCYTYHG
jgi:hypothetical protein